MNGSWGGGAFKPNRKPIEYSKNTKYDPMASKLIATLKSMNLTDSIKFILIFQWFTEHFLPEVMTTCEMQRPSKGTFANNKQSKISICNSKTLYRSVSINSIICSHQNWQKESCINYALHWFNNDTSQPVLHFVFVVVVVSFWCYWNGLHQIENLNGQSKSKLAHILWLFS